MHLKIIKFLQKNNLSNKYPQFILNDNVPIYHYKFNYKECSHIYTIVQYINEIFELSTRSLIKIILIDIQFDLQLQLQLERFITHINQSDLWDYYDELLNHIKYNPYESETIQDKLIYTDRIFNYIRNDHMYLLIKFELTNTIDESNLANLQIQKISEITKNTTFVKLTDYLLENSKYIILGNLLLHYCNTSSIVDESSIQKVIPLITTNKNVHLVFNMIKYLKNENFAKHSFVELFKTNILHPKLFLQLLNKDIFSDIELQCFRFHTIIYKIYDFDNNNVNNVNNNNNANNNIVINKLKKLHSKFLLNDLLEMGNFNLLKNFPFFSENKFLHEKIDIVYFKILLDKWIDNNNIKNQIYIDPNYCYLITEFIYKVISFNKLENNLELSNRIYKLFPLKFFNHPNSLLIHNKFKKYIRLSNCVDMYDQQLNFCYCNSILFHQISSKKISRYSRKFTKKECCDNKDMSMFIFIENTEPFTDTIDLLMYVGQNLSIFINNKINETFFQNNKTIIEKLIAKDITNYPNYFLEYIIVCSLFDYDL